MEILKYVNMSNMYQNRGKIETGERKTNLKGIVFVYCLRVPQSGWLKQ